MSSFIKDFTSVGLSKVAIIFFGLLRSIITARWLGPEVNGTIAALTVYPSLFMTFGSLGISQSATHFIGKNIYSEQSIKTSISQIWFFTSIISIVICFILIRYFSNSGENMFLIFLAVTPIPFTLFNKYNSGIFLGKNQIGTYNKINWLPTFIVFLFIVIFVVIFPLGINGAMLAAIAGPIFIFLLLLIKNDFISSFKLRFEWKVISALLSLGILYAIALLIINMNYKVNIIILDKLSTPFELGIFSKGVGIVDLLWEIPMLLSTIVFARSSNTKDNQQFSRKVAQLLRLSFVFIGAGSIFLLVLAKYLILLMFGREFILSTQVLRILMPGVLLLTIFKVLNMDLAGRGKPWISMKAMIPALILNVILNIILIPDHGGNGAAFSSTISYSVAAVLFLLFYSREVKIPIKEILKYSKNDFKPITSQFKRTLDRFK